MAATINYHLEQSDLPVAKKLQKDIYVDNVITGVSTPSQAKDLYVEAKSLFAAASENGLLILRSLWILFHMKTKLESLNTKS